MPKLRDLRVLHSSSRYFGRSEKRVWMAYGFLDGGHDLAEHGLDAERLMLAGGPVVRLGGHYGGSK